MLKIQKHFLCSILETVSAETLRANLDSKHHFTFCTLKQVCAKDLILCPKDQYHHWKPELQHCLCIQIKFQELTHSFQNKSFNKWTPHIHTLFKYIDWCHYRKLENLGHNVVPYMFVFKKTNLFTQILSLHIIWTVNRKSWEKSHWKASITIKGIQSLKQHFLHS